MTVISRTGYKPEKRKNLRATHIRNTNEISIVIPVKDNQPGIEMFLEKFFAVVEVRHFPREIIIVDNNSAVPIYVKANYPAPVKLVTCKKPGPASARNTGLTTSNGEWILFTDSDCIPHSTMLSGYLNVQAGAIGYAGHVKAFGHSILDQYYQNQEILLPPKVKEKDASFTPEYLITANCLIWKPALAEIGGFNENITIAAGEDIDTGFRLREIGALAHAHDSLVWHNFSNSLCDFRKRFIRYGMGNKLISNYYQIDLKPRPFKPLTPSLVNYVLAFLQYIWMKKGFNKV